MKTSFAFSCDQFNPTQAGLDDSHEDYINPRIFTKEAAEFLARGLTSIGFKVIHDFPEDWGRWVEIENPDGYFLAVGVANFDAEGELRHKFFVEPDKSPIRKWLKKIDTVKRVM